MVKCTAVWNDESRPEYALRQHIRAKLLVRVAWGKILAPGCGKCILVGGELPSCMKTTLPGGPLVVADGDEVGEPEGVTALVR